MTSGWATSPDAIQRAVELSHRTVDVFGIEKRGVIAPIRRR